MQKGVSRSLSFMPEKFKQYLGRIFTAQVLNEQGRLIMEEVASREQLERVIETIPDGVIIMDKDGCILFANAATEAIFGLARKDIIGRIHSDPVFKVTTIDGKPILKKEHPFAKVFQTGEPVYNFEHVHERPDGTRVIVSANAAPLYDKKGAVVGLVASLTDTTERKKAEEELKESERRFRKMLEEVELVAVILDAQGKITFVNDFLLNLTGWQRNEVIGKDWFKIFLPDEEREQVRSFFFKSVAEGEIQAHYENDIITSWDERRTISFTNVLLRDFQGYIIGSASIGHDITEEKRAVEEINESRRQVLDILESITDGFFAVDNDWRFTYVNHKAEELLRKRKEELLFRSMWDAFPEVVGTTFYKEFKRAKEEMLPLSFEEFYPPLDKWFEVHVYPYENGLSGYFDDATKRKHIEEALKASEKKLRDITSALGEGVFVLNGEGRLTFMNREAERLLGWTEAELLGKDVHPIIHYQRADGSPIHAKDCPVLNVIKTGKAYHTDDDVLTRKDGKTLPVAYVSTPIIENGKVTASVTAFFDITERKQAVQKKKAKHHA